MLPVPMTRPEHILSSTPSPAPPTPQVLPYKIACLCDLRDDQGRVLLLHRLKAPNKGLYSPIGGKLEMTLGESPTQCAQREIFEEAGIDIPIERLHLMGLISETAFEGSCHWLLFYFRVLGPVQVKTGPMNEGVLQWHQPEAIEQLGLPQSDREIIWPMVQRVDAKTPHGVPGFFAVHIDCVAAPAQPTTTDPADNATCGTPGMTMHWRIEQEIPPCS